MVQCAFFTKSQSHAGTFGKAWTLSGFAWKSGGRGFPGGKENPIQPPRRAFSARRDGQIAIRQQISNICSNKLRKNDKICPQKAKFMLDFSKSSAIINSAVRPESAGVAQPVEQLICNQQVGGSNPSTSSSLFRTGDGAKSHTGEFQSGQMGQTVNLLSTTSVVRIHLPPPERDCFIFLKQSRCVFASLSCRFETVPSARLETFQKTGEPFHGGNV